MSSQASLGPQVYPQESDETVANLADDSYTFLRVEAIAEDDLELEDGLDINCCHVSPSDNRRVSRLHLCPFRAFCQIHRLRASKHLLEVALEFVTLKARYKPAINTEKTWPLLLSPSSAR